MLASTSRHNTHRASASRALIARRLNSTHAAAQASRPRPSPKGQGLDQPKAIFWGWAALIVVAGFGYFTVKSNNTAKKREYMIKQGQQLREQRDAVADGDQPAATSSPVLMSSGNQEKYAQSPLQSLAAALNRQTTQRSRNPDAARSGSDSSE
ncbi:hypothetical protein PHBOTO_001572 [Pseudozyma hubeiensis]|nr:hypothetical protein PHBOTO_001572 [Pseudozyma hubeiensis]